MKELKFKKDKMIYGLWEAGKYVIEKSLETNEYLLYIDGARYSVSKTLKTAKSDANKHFNKK